jgi:2-keto-3-deoxy-6-phosphogluconate aldolase
MLTLAYIAKNEKQSDDLGAEYDCLRVSKRCGLKAIEVTMNTPNAEVIIKNMRSIADPLDILVGAGYCSIFK